MHEMFIDKEHNLTDQESRVTVTPRQVTAGRVGWISVRSA